MTATYQKRGLKFLYPENWKLTDEAETDLPCSISLETPDGGALWAVHLYEIDSDPDEILKTTLATLQVTYPDLEITPCQTDFAAANGTAVEAMFFCLDFLIRARLQVIPNREYQLLFWFQAEDREFDKLELIFQALATSVLQG